MIEVKRPEQKSVVLIRTATPQEFSNYEKWKLENIQEGAEVNKIEVIEVSTTNGSEISASVQEKVAKIELGNLALKDEITDSELSEDDIFMIECSL